LVDISDFVDTTPIEYILTVPAVWSDKAKSDTLWCASQAGFGPIEKIRLITEPEVGTASVLEILLPTSEHMFLRSYDLEIY
jgi:molecular chaperone DnaK (HSP70)